MTAKTHTPGPWKASCELGDKIHITSTAFAPAEGHGPVAIAHTWADAKLIAQAPAMRALLESVLFIAVQPGGALEGRILEVLNATK